jgi:RND superfamily putative drug exporter
MSRASSRVRRPRAAGLLDRIASLVTRRSRLVIAIWIVAVAALAIEGRDLDRKLTIHPPFIDGTASKRAHEISQREFGGDNAMVVMLRGPRAAVDRQGRDLASRLDAMPHTLAISPWARDARIDGLRPSPGVAAIIVRVESDSGEQAADLLPPVRHLVDTRVASPVRASMAGFPVIIDSLRNAGNDATAIGELIAVPVLLIVLLLVFRSVLAALMPVVAGGAVVAATRGILSLLLNLVQIDLFALAVVGMLGLALGVDYSLLVISRFREELEGRDVAEAVRRTVIATSRSVVPAGGGLILAMFMASLVLPGAIVQSIAIAVVTATVLSMLSAIVVVPALLTVLGNNLERWSLPRRRASPAPLAFFRRMAGHRGVVISIMAVLVLLAGWAFALDSGATGTRLLPPGDKGRQELEDVEAGLGPGWIAPMEVVVNGRGKPVTSPQRLHALAAFQRQVERDPGVETMAGLARLDAGARKLGGIEGELSKQERGLEKLGTGISRIRAGTVLNSNGLQKAAEGSRGLNSGLGAANAGTGVLAGALQKTSTGSSQLSNGLSRVDEGSSKVAQGTTKASTGAGKLADALALASEKTEEGSGSAQLFKNAMHSGDDRLGELHAPLQSTEERLAAAWQALQQMTTGRGDPEYAALQRALEEAELQLNGKDVHTGEQANPSYAGIGSGIARAEGQFGVGLYLASRMEKSNHQASVGIGKLADASAQLDHGLQRLATGSRQVSAGVGALARGGQKLSPALQKLGHGADRLAGGLDLLETGSGQLASGLGTGAEKSKLLTHGLDRIDQGLEQSGSGGGSGLTQLQRQSPGLFHSAYFILADLDGSRPAQRSQLVSLVNLDRGGMDARMLVIPADEPTSDQARATKDRLEADAEGLARRTNAEVVVGGVAPSEIDVNDSIRGQAPLMRIVLSLVSLIILIPVMRSLIVPVFAALINLITVSASFGILALLFNGSLLGGPGFVDASVIPGTMMVMFGLAIDYEVFVFARIREEYVRTGSTDAAIKGGLDRTGHVVTGAAIIMISVFLAFSVSEFMTIRNFGVAQAIAVFIDAFLIRLIVVPAVMGWLGKWCWWMPRWPSGRSRARPG